MEEGTGLFTLCPPSQKHFVSYKLLLLRVNPPGAHGTGPGHPASKSLA